MHAEECKAVISAMCTKPADGGGKRAGFQRLRPETCQKSHEKAPFLCSNCTEKEVGGCDTWVGGIVPQSRLGVFIAMVSAFRHPKDTRYVFPARFAQVKRTMTGNLSSSKRPSRCAWRARDFPAPASDASSSPSARSTNPNHSHPPLSKTIEIKVEAWSFRAYNTC